MKDWDKPHGTKMHFLFGKEACEMYFNKQNTLEILDKWNNGEIMLALYTFEHGKTNPAHLLHMFNGWEDYVVLDQEDFDILNS